MKSIVRWLFLVPVFAIGWMVSPLGQERFVQTNRCYNGARWVDCPQAEQPAEKPDSGYPTRQWLLGYLPGVDNRLTDDPDKRFRVDVIDTRGACLYIVTGYHRIDTSATFTTQSASSSVGLSTAIGVMPKSQLPKGVGCQ